MPSDAITSGNCRRDEFFAGNHRLRQILAERERGANRGGIGAAGAMRVRRPLRAMQKVLVSVLPSKKISIACEVSTQMSPFHQYGTTPATMDFPRGTAHFFTG